MLDPLKVALSEFVHLSKDALHIHLGLAVYLIAALLLRRPAGSWWPWLVLLALELVNEVLDLGAHMRHGGISLWSIGGSLKDIVNTMFWPTALLIALRSGLLSVSSPRHKDDGSKS